MMRRYRLKVGEREFTIDVQEQTADRYTVTVDGQSYEVMLADDDSSPAVNIAPRAVAATEAPKPAATASGNIGTLSAPMPGVILEVMVKAGDTIERGQPVAVLDAMKMHNTITSPRSGIVAEILVTAGQTVDHGEAILKYREA